MTETKKKRKQAATQLCWSCSMNASNCAWMRRYKPIEGWTAKESEIRNRSFQNPDKTIPSYEIKKCPNYIKDNRKNKKRKVQINIKNSNCIKCINCKYAHVDKLSSTKDWEAYECTNKDSEYYKCLLNVTANGDKQFKISWGGCEYGQADRRAE